MLRGLKLVYKGMCPNCGGDIEGARLYRGLPCSSCISDSELSSIGSLRVEDIASYMARRGRLKGYKWLFLLEREFKIFSSYFKSRTGKDLWSAQRMWARKLLSLSSMAIIAPTGVGKTTLLMVYMAYRVERNGWRAVYLVPTENLLRQVASKLSGLSEGVVYYYSSMPKRLREEALTRIEKGDYSIAVVTTGFLQRRFSLLAKSAPIDLVVVDDVDSMLRNSRNVDRVLALLGFDWEAIELAHRLVEVKLRAYKALLLGNDKKLEALERELVETEKRLRDKTSGKLGQLVIASATGRPRGYKHMVFKELLGFEVGGGTDYLRNVVDSFIVSSNPVEEAFKLVNRLGRGGLIFVSQSLGRGYAKLLAEALIRKGARVGLALSGSRRALEKLERGELEAVVSVASRYGVTVRGIDMPETIRYAVFVGVPSIRRRLEEYLLNPKRLARVLVEASADGWEGARELSLFVAKLLEKRDADTIYYMLREASKGRLREAPEWIQEFLRGVEAARSWLLSRLSKVKGLVIGSNYFKLEDDGSIYVYIPDIPTYIQASGRTSRMLGNGMTLGLSVIIDSEEALIEAFGEKLSWYVSSRLASFYSLDIDAVLGEIEKTRRRYGGKRIDIRTVLVVVESPTKARTISWFWGRPAKRRMGRTVIYETSAIDEKRKRVYLLQVAASKGHIFDLSLDNGYGVEMRGETIVPMYSALSRCLACGHSFSGSSSCPRCGSINRYNSLDVLEALRKVAAEVEEILILTDPDREGEKIAWDLYLALKPYNRNIYRAHIHEITRTAVIEALANPKRLDTHLVEAQIARRVEDRLIGFSLSRRLWTITGKRWTGAGRVQTPVLGWIIDRFGEWKKNRGYSIVLELENGEKLRLFVTSKAEAEKLAASKKVTIGKIEVWKDKAKPAPPYTTDSLLYDASKTLGLPAGIVMKIAQNLFDGGLITYHRTDSTRVSPAGIAVAKNYMENRGLQHLFTPRSWGEGGAHEAIRPTKPLDPETLHRLVLEGSVKVPFRFTRIHLKLYSLIFKRFMASQMKEAVLLKSRVTWHLPGHSIEKTYTVDAVDKGFTVVLDLKKSKWLEKVKPGSSFRVVASRVYRSSKATLYTTGDVVRLMKERGIGRPSTYSKAIEANIRHGYVVLSKRLKYLIPTRFGMDIYEYLYSNFEELISEETSRKLEETLDLIEKGEEEPARVILDIWEKIKAIDELTEKLSATAMAGSPQTA
ncbi:MAG: reverse gyrase [Desulfurococcales archaeon]|nr:reverse gyrase [Desulfurococcales archaeon]